MRTAEEILNELIDERYKNVPMSIKTDFERKLPESGHYISAITAIKQAQKEAWNEAVDACSENATTTYKYVDFGATEMVVDKQSILKLKK